MIRKTIFIISLLSGTTGLTLAGEQGNPTVIPTGFALTAPETENLWVIGLEGQLMMPIDKFQFAHVAAHDGKPPHNESVDDEHDWGWEADIAYQFADTGRDIRFSYTDLNMSDTEGYSVTPNTVIYGINGRNSPLNLTNGGNAYGTATYHYRAADLTVGQLLAIGQRLTLHPFAGLRYGKIDVLGVAKYITDAGQENKFTSDSTFNGLGPRAGMDIAIRLCYGFSFVGTIGTSLLMGNMNENYQVGTAVQSGGAAPYLDNDNAEIFSVIPEIDGSLGVNYHANITAKTNIDLQVGDQVVNYHNADVHDYIDTLYVNSTVNNTNFGYHGLYVRTQVSFA